MFHRMALRPMRVDTTEMFALEAPARKPVGGEREFEVAQLSPSPDENV